MTQTGLYRSHQHKMIAGVMGGIAEHFGWNANLLRILFVSISILSSGFPGILIYLILWFVIPLPQRQLDRSAQYPTGQMRTVYEEGQNKH